MPLFALRFVNPERYRRLGGVFSRADIAQASAVAVGQIVLLVAALAMGHGLDWLCLWFIPTRR